MRQWNDTKRARRVLGIVLAVAALTAPAAQGGQEDFGAKPALDMIHGRTNSVGPLDPWAARVIEYGTNATNVSPDSRAVDFRTYRSDDVGPLDPWATRVIESGTNATNVSPDSRPVDFRTASPALISTASGDSFEWGDAGIGAGAMFALCVLLAGAGTLLVRRSHGRLASR